MRVSVVAGLIVAVHVAVIGSVVMTQGCVSTRTESDVVVPAPVETAPVPPMPPSADVAPVAAPVAFPALQPPVQPAPVKTAVAAENVYVVKPGDSLSKIAAAHGVKTKDLMAANNVVDANKIRAGQKLVIPGAKKAAKSEDKAADKKAEKKDEKKAEKQDEKKVEAPAAEPVAPLPAPVPEVAPAAPAPAPEAAGIQDAMLDYNVQEGDTVDGIARLFVVSADEIRKVNGLAAGEEVVPGKTIKIPPSM